MPTNTSLRTITSLFSVQNADEFLNRITDPDRPSYLFFGKTDQWENEPTPDGISDTLEDTLSIWENINSLKRITEADVTAAVARIPWTAGVVYDIYDSSLELKNLSFYVITDRNDVYKCIENGNGSPSRFRPTHRDSEISNEADGYRWKYMFTVSQADIDKFLTDLYIPITFNEDIVNSAVPGTIDNVKVVQGGTGYPEDSVVTAGQIENAIPVFVEGNGQQNGTAFARISASQGQVLTITEITNSGFGYSFVPPQNRNIPVALRQRTPSNGTNQTAYGIANTDSTGAIESVEVVLQGENYIDGGEVQIIESSCRAFAETDQNGVIIRADIITGSAGSMFNKARCVIVSDQGQDGIIEPIISPPNGHGSDPKTELLARDVMINIRIAGEEDFITADDFRQIGIISGVVPFDASEVETGTDGQTEFASGAVLDAKYRVNIETGSNDDFIAGESIIGESSGALGTQIGFINSDAIRFTLDDSLGDGAKFLKGKNCTLAQERIRGVTSGATAIINSVTPPDIKPYLGDVVFINNREIVTRTADLQIETITLIINF